MQEERGNLFEKRKGVLVTLLSTHTLKHASIYSNKIDEETERLDLGGCKLKFSMWGNFDIAFIVLTDDNKELLNLSNLQPLSFTKDWRYYFGTATYPEELDIKETMERLPLFGVSLIKFKKEMWASLNTDLDGFLEWLSERIESALLKIGAKEENFKFALITSYGWEDIILLFFSNSYRRIKRVILELRTSSALELKGAKMLKEEGMEGKHIIATTCSMLGINFDFNLWEKQGKKYKKTFFQKIEKNEKLGWEIKIQTRPGHSDAIRHKLKGKNIIGRNDLVIIKENKTLKKFFNSFFFSKDNIFSLISDKKNPVVSNSETSFFFNFGNADVEGGKIESDWPERKEEWKPPDFKELEKLLLDLGIPVHTSQAINNLLVTINHLKKDLDLINDGFISLFNMLSILPKAFELINKSQSDSKLKDKLETKTLWWEITDWFRNFDLCFKDRFRGIYPAGETSTMPLITYQGSFHKFLMVVDSIACLSFERAALSVGEEFNKKPPPHIIATYIGNPPTPCIYRSTLLLSGFIYAPVDLMFYPERLFYIFHETGHSFFSMCEFYGFLNLKTKDTPNNKKVQTLFNEVLADYFAGTMGFGGNWQAFEAISRGYLYYLAIQEKPELELRLALSKALYSYNGKLTKENPEIKRILENQNFPKETKELLDYLIYNLESEDTYLKRLLNSLRKREMPPSFSKEYEDILIALQEFFKMVADNSSFSDQGRRQFFHSFWLKAYKKAVSACFLKEGEKT